MEQEQKEDLVKIAKESLRFLKEIFEHGWAAYPVSLLPYPKEKIKEALENYLGNWQLYEECGALAVAFGLRPDFSSVGFQKFAR